MSSRPDLLLARRGGVVEWLRLPAFLMSAVSGLRNRMYDAGWLASQRVGLPIISVGNLTVGGTGKTPMVAWVVRALLERGLVPGVLSRGYRGAQQNTATGGQGLNDEGRLLSAMFPDLLQVQNPDRVAGARELQQAGAGVIVLDDGFQHRRLARDVDLVLVDATRPWGLPPDGDGTVPVRAVLPRGLLREKVASLGRASALVITRSDALEPVQLQKLEDELQREAPGCVRLLGEHRPSGLRQGDECFDIEHLRGRRVRLVSGIGNPEAFERTARLAGACIESVHAFADHHAFTAEELKAIPGEGELLVTSKDSVKLEVLGVAHLVLEIEFTLTRGEKVLQALIDALPRALGSQKQKASLNA